MNLIDKKALLFIADYYHFVKWNDYLLIRWIRQIAYQK